MVVEEVGMVWVVRMVGVVRGDRVVGIVGVVLG